MGLSPHVNIAYTVFEHNTAIYNLTTLCLNGTRPCVGFKDVIIEIYHLWDADYMTISYLQQPPGTLHHVYSNIYRPTHGDWAARTITSYGITSIQRELTTNSTAIYYLLGSLHTA